MRDRKPHVTDVELGVIASRATTEWELMTIVRDEYEAKVATDAELIQQLVNDLRRLRIEFGNSVGHTTQIGIAALAAADAHGFKPTEP